MHAQLLLARAVLLRCGRLPFTAWPACRNAALEPAGGSLPHDIVLVAVGSAAVAAPRGIWGALWGEALQATEARGCVLSNP